MKLFDQYLKSHGTTRAQVARDTGINASLLQRASDREASDINSHILFTLAEALNKTPGRVMDELIEMEMANDMTTDETKLLLVNALDEADATALVTVEDMGDGDEAIVAEIDLPSGETICFSANKGAEPITKYDVITQLSYAMDDYDHENDGQFFPSNPSEGVERPLIDAQFTGVSKADSEYLTDLSSKIFKARK